METSPHVLIVDDNVDLAEVTCELLSMSGLSAIYRTSVSEALDVLATHADSIRALVTDINLASPMSGIELALYVAEEWPDVAICVMSGMTTDRPKRLPEGTVFMAKPWHAPDLIAFATSTLRSPGGAGGSSPK